MSQIGLRATMAGPAIQVAVSALDRHAGNLAEAASDLAEAAMVSVSGSYLSQANAIRSGFTARHAQSQ
jgi:hypothetical protein